MDDKEAMEILLSLGAVLKGHFLLSSGKHSDTYIQCAKLFQYPKYSELFSKKLADEFAIDKIDVVIGPALGGVVLAYEMAKQLNVRGIFAERVQGQMQLRRGFEINRGEKVLIVEDVITTGGSTKEVMQVVKKLGGEIIGIGSVVDRSNDQVDFGVKFKSLLKINAVTYEPPNCPLCKKGIPVVKPGSRGNRS
ncbi:orotate phosphoribosyltransferase [Kosmotoga arenicorallina S304]|uniref:Orotate phosphoribosyltransferase n=1 Tax=Kosmotoga arenicorallina S304 TaxID=1453497 RepID=A0A176K3Y8_9BACT|nr:orotate phosphoribosyltransferase [Kosmotoga arenicorallina]OAA31827.1 orotate phosphoribosyltransferase [Kosmotoga arenicorallina S304]